LAIEIVLSIISGSMPASRYLSGARTDGSTPTIREGGSSGIAGTIWAAECRRKTFDRSNGGRQCDDIFARSNFTASEAILPVANASDRLFYTGHTIAEHSEPGTLIVRHIRPRQSLADQLLWNADWWSQPVDATLYLKGEMGCALTGQRFSRGFTAAEKTELWDRWKRGESLKAIEKLDASFALHQAGFRTP
jgi:hypothetical protein